MLEFLPFIGLALLLGIKHSFDADHLIAVSSVLRKVTSVHHAVKSGLSWALGHMLTAALITVLLFLFRESFLSSWLSPVQKLVGVLLIVLGAWSFFDLFHFHAHQHGSFVHSHPHLHGKSQSHNHRHMFGIGIMHGLASNGELLLLLTLSLGASALGIVLLGIGFFSLGVVLGMVLFAGIFSLGWLKLRQESAYRVATFVIGWLSISYGITMLL